MKYTIRKLDSDCWIDVFAFAADEKPQDVAETIAKHVKNGVIRIFVPTRFCLIENRLNGREHQVGVDVVVRPNGGVVGQA